MNSADRQTI